MNGVFSLVHIRKDVLNIFVGLGLHIELLLEEEVEDGVPRHDQVNKANNEHDDGGDVHRSTEMPVKNDLTDGLEDQSKLHQLGGVDGKFGLYCGRDSRPTQQVIPVEPVVDDEAR